MAERLNALMKVTEPAYVQGAPLLLEAYALYRDTATERCIAQLKWKNIGSKPIKAVMIELDGCDTFDQRLEPVNYQYDDLAATQGADFGGKTPIEICSNNMVRYDVLLKAISYADGEVWHADAPALFSTLPTGREQSLTGDLLAQYKRDLAKQGIVVAARYEPRAHQDLWQCGCGSWQYAGEPCLKCRATMDALNVAASKELLEAHLREYNAEQEQIRIEAEKQAEEARIAQEKAAEEQRVRDEENRRKQAEAAEAEAAQQKVAREQRKKKAMVLGPIAAAVVVLVILLVTVIVPNIHMNGGDRAFSAGQYDEAYREYAAAGKRGAEKATEAAQRYGDELMDQFRYEEAFKLYAEAGVHAGATQSRLLLDAIDGDVRIEPLIDKERLEAEEKALLEEGSGSEPDLPRNVYAYTRNNGDTYGLLHVGDNRWISKDRFSYINYRNGVLYGESKTNCVIFDIETGAETTLPKAVSMRYPSGDGVWCKTTEGLFGYYALDGSVILDAEYTEVTLSGDSGLFSVKKDGLYGFVNAKGEVVIDCQYEEAYNFHGGYCSVYAKAKKVKQGDSYVALPEGWGVIDTSGNLLVDTKWQSTSVYDGFAENGVVKVYDGQHYGMVSLQNETLLSCRYTDIGVFGDGVVYVEVKEGDNYPNSVAGFVNAQGEMVLNLMEIGIDGSYGADDETNIFINGCALIKAWVGGVGYSRTILSSLIDRNGQTLIDWTDCLFRDTDGDLRKWDSHMKSVLADYYTEDGKVFVKTSDSPAKTSPFMAQWGVVYDFSEEGIARVALNSHTEKSSLTDSTWTAADPPYGYVTKDETVLVDPVYELAYDFENGYAAVRLNGQWGLIDTTGAIVLEPQYAGISKVFGGDKVVVEQNNRFAVIDLEGNVIINRIQEINGSNSVSFSTDLFDYNGLIRFKINDQWQMIDCDANRVL